MTAAGPTAALARFASELELDAVPPAAVRAAKRSLLDALGCAVHGAQLPWSRMVQELAVAEGGAPEAAVWGTTLRTSPAAAALANATAAHGFELDDVHMGGMIHTGALTAGAALPLVNRGALDGRGLLAALIAGCEVGARVGSAVGTPHFAAGFHPQGTVGAFAAAASAGRALRLGPAALQHTLGVAGSQAAGLMAAQEGAMVKRLHSGRAAQAGVTSALLAGAGFTGIPNVLEADFGGFCGTLGGGSVDIGALTDGLGERWEVERIGFKAYASCAAAHTSLEVVRRLRADHGLAAGDVRSVAIAASTHAAVHCGWRYEPAGITAAQMSIPYGVARMLLDGEVTGAAFTDGAIAAPEALDLAARVRVTGDEAIDALGPARRYTVRVAIETRDGTVFRGTADDRPGNPDQPLSDAALERKLRSLAEPVLGSAAADALIAAVGALDADSGPAALEAALVPAGPAPSGRNPLTSAVPTGKL